MNTEAEFQAKVKDVEAQKPESAKRSEPWLHDSAWHAETEAEKQLHQEMPGHGVLGSRLGGWEFNERQQRVILVYNLYLLIIFEWGIRKLAWVGEEDRSN